jgi:hypothetical protein
MLTAYMDESGNEADRVVIAGFWGDRTQWGNLEGARIPPPIIIDRERRPS